MFDLRKIATVVIGANLMDREEENSLVKMAEKALENAGVSKDKAKPVTPPKKDGVKGAPKAPDFVPYKKS